MNDKERKAAAPKSRKRNKAVRCSKPRYRRQVQRDQSRRVKRAFAEIRAEQERDRQCDGILHTEPEGMGQYAMNL